MNLVVLLPLIAVLIALQRMRINLPAWIAVWWVAIYVLLRYGFTAPLPRSVLDLYMGIATLSLAAYVGSSRTRTRAVLSFLDSFITERRFTPLLALVCLLIPAALGMNVYRSATRDPEPPYFARTVHPAPPQSISVHETEIDLIRTANPLRELRASAPDVFEQHVENGKRRYYRECVYCHGAALNGQGLFIQGLDPLPTKLAEGGLLDSFQESYFFWRIAKGGPGLPEEAGPGSSSMPSWEQFLSTEEIWEVVLFLYDFTGSEPREVGEFVNE
jgi:mono/diheme cytochrome c family protein